MAAYDRKKTKAAAPTHDTRLSRQLSKLLRHRLHDAGLTDCLRPDGFVPVGRVLACLPEGATVDALRRVVEDNDKQRFALLEEAGALYVRANQGHSVSLGLDDAAMLAEVSAAEAGGFGAESHSLVCDARHASAQLTQRAPKQTLAGSSMESRGPRG